MILINPNISDESRAALAAVLAAARDRGLKAVSTVEGYSDGNS